MLIFFVVEQCLLAAAASLSAKLSSFCLPSVSLSERRSMLLLAAAAALFPKLEGVFNTSSKPETKLLCWPPIKISICKGIVH